MKTEEEIRRLLERAKTDRDGMVATYESSGRQVHWATEVERLHAIVLAFEMVLED